jgi:hypothetical protein
MSPLIALCLLVAQPAPAASPTPAEVVSRMLARYAAANTLTGTIRFVQSAQGSSLQIDTRIQYDRAAAKLYIRQVRAGPSADSWLVVSDGRIFTYDTPVGFDDPRGKRLYERLDQGGGVVLDLGGVYAASTLSLGDRSLPLDVAIGRIEHLRFRRNQWVNLTFGPSPAEGVRVVRGDWREYGEAPVSGTFEMWIDADGDLVRYVQRDSITVQQPPQTLMVVSDWTVNLTVGGAPDPALFVIPR